MGGIMKKITSADIIQQIGADEELKKEIMEMIAKNPDIGTALAGKDFEEMPRRAAAVANISKEVSTADAEKVFNKPETLPPQVFRGLEAIVFRIGRPVLKIMNDDYSTDELETDTWKARLQKYRKSLKSAIPSVGRIELENSFFSWVGTGWLVAEDIIVTNRHVAKEFAREKDGKFIFRQGLFGNMEALIDFREEYKGHESAEYGIKGILHIEDDNGPDLAFLAIEWGNGGSQTERTVISLGEALKKDQYIAIIGYPAKDTRTKISAEMDAIFGNVYDIKRLAPGQIMGVDESHGVFIHSCTTLGGNSGSVVIDMESGKAVGLHFGGTEEVANYAVPAPLVKERLETLKAKRTSIPGLTPFAGEEVEEVPKLEDMLNRSGFDPDFLEKTVPLPGLSSALHQQTTNVVGRDDSLLQYIHYSVLMHASRRLAIYAACNIDGANWRRVLRGRDRWYFDPRIERDFQLGNELYAGNKLDRGHLVRRLDPAWGETLEAAELAAQDTFFYTNCAPQHKQLNQRLWLDLEDYILGNADVYDLKISVFNGPVFRPCDRMYRGVRIPEDFWKVVAMVRSDTGELSVTAYVLSQMDFMDDLEFAFGPHKTYQVPVAQIEQLTGLDFGDLKNSDPMAISEARPFVEILGLESVRF
jgi:endonuclease G